ncbi:MAG: FtsQ-type POTRA domain-containing protein [Deltaproteobacteria bacterium]|nr:FtsQ-type POTRA domain-containing protein [Deltaproteobacteria bacterium]
MSKKTLLSRQSVTRKRQDKGRPLLREMLKFLTSVSFKVLILIVGMASISFIFIYFYKCLINSPYLRLEYIQISGVDEEIKSELIEISGLNDGLSLLTIEPNRIKARMEQHPWVRTVQLEKRFPHTLAVSAEKELPRALVLFESLFYMNRWGAVFKEVEQGDDVDYPVITGISRADDDAGKKLAIAAAILEGFESESGLLSLNDISEIHVNDGGDALIYSMSLPVAIKMCSDNLEKGKSRLKRLVTHLQETNMIDTIKVIDMNYLDGAVVSFKGPNGMISSLREDKTTAGL